MNPRTNGTVLYPLGLQVFFALVIPFAVTQGYHPSITLTDFVSAVA